MKKLIALMLLSIGGAAQSATVAIDFNELPFGPTGALSVSSQGFIFSSEAEFVVNGSPTDRALWYCPFCSVTMENEAGQLFDLLSFDFATILGGAGTVSVTGHYAAGGTVSTSLGVDDMIDTYLFDASWADLSQLVIVTPMGVSPDYVGSLDNVVMNVIPIPAAVWLFGSGLGLLGWMRRRKLS